MHVSNRLDKPNTMASFSFSHLSCQKGYQWKKNVSVKTIIFRLVTSGAKTELLTLDQIWSKTLLGHEESYPVFFLTLPMCHTFGINSHCLRKIPIFSEFDLRWPLVPSTSTWPENNLCKSLRSLRGLSKAICCLSLSSVVFLDTMKPPPAINWPF